MPPATPIPFRPPPRADEPRPCLRCKTQIVAAGTMCVSCAHAIERESWRGYVDIAYAEARKSVPARYRAARFDGDDHRAPEVSERAVGLAHRSAVFAGPTSAGKTWFACAVLHEHLRDAADRWQPGRPESIEHAERLVRLAATSRYERAYELATAAAWDERWAEWRGAELLIVDDLGLEPASGLAAITNILIERYDRRLQTLITWVHVDADALGQRYGDGVLRRLGAGVWISC